MPFNETGHAKNVANLKKTITACTAFGAKYNPSNTNIRLKALNKKHDDGDAAVAGVEPFKKPYKDAIDARHVQYNLLTPLMRSALGVLKSGDGVSATTVKDAETLVKKIAGTNRKKAKAATGKAAAEEATPADDAAKAGDAENTDEPTAKSHSVSQQSFDMRLDNSVDFVALLAGESTYAPNEPDITVAALTTFLGTLKTVNEAVASVYVDYSKAMQTRDIELYAADTGLIDIVKKVKSYVSGVTTLSDTDKKLVTGLIYNKPAKKNLHF